MKLKALLVGLVFAVAAGLCAAQESSLRTVVLIAQASSTQTGGAKGIYSMDPTIGCVVRGFVSGSGSVSATIVVYGTTTPASSGGVALGTITLTGTTLAADGFSVTAPWPYMYADVTAVSGSASVEVAGYAR